MQNCLALKIHISVSTYILETSQAVTTMSFIPYAESIPIIKTQIPPTYKIK